MSTTHVLHFEIHGDWYTQQYRDLWASGKYSTLLDIHTDNTDDLQLMFDVINGKKAFSGVNEFEIVEDDFDPDYPEASISAIFSLASETSKLRSKLLGFEAANATRLVQEIDTCHNGERLADLYHEARQIPDEVWDYMGYDGAPSPTEYHHRVMNPRKSETLMMKALMNPMDECSPTDIEESKAGIIADDGTFYGCDYGQHGNLLEILGEQEIAIEHGVIIAHYPDTEQWVFSSENEQKVTDEANETWLKHAIHWSYEPEF